MDCEHHWEPWRPQSFWRDEPSAEPTVRTWVRLCPGCESQEYLRLSSGGRPQETSDVRGWLIPPG